MRRLLVLPALILTLTACGRLSSGQVSAAESEARAYAQRNFPEGEITNIRCKDLNSDADGYVRCELSVKLPNGDVKTPNIECAYGKAMSWAEGCQQPKAGNQG